MSEAQKRPGTLDIIEEITRKDGSTYYEIGNMVHNGRSELAAERGFIQQVRILKLNIPHSQNVIKYEEYINEHYYVQPEAMDHFEEWEKPAAMADLVAAILKENHVG
ncbi:hypothetical protein [Limosilactobacillus ingluviei]|uniref:Uncharacterized protein n=1 Tax=Limosilactobacillus ingluviei TaxID=148604 RepID=A0A0R2H228_9LACO|nr:hypothetical protein [Limosilactobacillus ingluviei]KRN43802.1 hypothetical protein IV41_GL001257 [Limosilactobacillus ingluviei]MBM6727916.1 hypothetical protein [Limosilactobacillus ingluviei]MDO4603587.1 hypothetical protein [Limosilactobacillus ingluviei]